MAGMVRIMCRAAGHRRINGAQIKEIADEFGIGDRADPLVSELKAAGIMNPKLSPVTEILKVRAPIYELNPSLFANESD
jgi:hypothetical protein